MRETYSALQSTVFLLSLLFFYHPCPGIVNRCSWFWEALSLVDRGYEFSFVLGIHVRIDIRIDISIPIVPMITKFSMQVHLNELNQIRLI